ncbi:MAG TPA: cyclic nucleotide-binding domain-containing protein [Thermoanaerobaculia bacterium]|nr:cyclic nucleotide-binding domain-containing protein [Thermoanaerobaculia bacterium]
MGRSAGDDPTSPEALREELRRAAIDAAHFVGLGHLFADKGDDARALACLEIAEAKRLADPSPHKLRGRLLLRAGDPAAAAAELAKALRLNPFDRETAEALAHAEYECQRFAPAIAAAVDTFLLLGAADGERAERVKLRIRTLRKLLSWTGPQLLDLFHERQERLRLAFDRLAWRQELFRAGEESGARSLAPAAAARAAGQIELAARLRRLELLAPLTDEQIFHLSRAVHPELAERGKLVFGHGSTGTDVFFIERGEVTIRRPTACGTFPLGVLGPGELFGEMNFISRCHRSGDAVASQQTQLLRADGGELELVLSASPELGVQLCWTFWHALASKLRATNEQLRALFSTEALPENFVRLRRVPPPAIGADRLAAGDKVRLFREQGLSGRELEMLATFSKERRFPAGARIFSEGDPGTELYVVVEGRTRIGKPIAGGGEEVLAILERGDFFGEMSLIDGQPRSADASAHGGPVTALALDQATVNEVLAMDPQVALGFLQLLCRLIAKRLREIDEKVIGWRIQSGERAASSETA